MLISIGIVQPLFSQINQWSWINGDDVPHIRGIYGTKGQPSNLNKPGSRRLSVSWTDTAGNFWLFGGNGYGTSGPLGYLNDLWKYNPTTNQWTWVDGDNSINVSGNYGVQGMAAIGNKPGARRRSVGWVDNQNNLWLFGGNGYDGVGQKIYLNDLWKYNIATNTWTWVKGDTLGEIPGVYGVQGTAAASNKPGARYAAASWSYQNGRLWLFGGNGKAATQEGDLNDLWMFDIVTGNWTWMKGDMTADEIGVYGTQGIGNPINKPGARTYAITWKEANNELWLFGGSYLNDLWKYTISTNQWTWMKGSAVPNEFGVYGTQGLATPTTVPGAREAGTAWKDAQGNLWLFGGDGYGQNEVGYLNDLWKYNVNTNQWTWMKGSNTIDVAGVYGTRGISAPANMPGARPYAANWKDKDGNLWLFGGDGFYQAGANNYLNDLWKYNANSYLTTGNGDWNNPSTWLDGVVPPANATVIVRHILQIATNVTCFSLKIEPPSGQVVVATGIQLTITH